MTQREAFLRQAASCDARSPLYAGLCRRLADEPLVAELVDQWSWEIPLRLLGGLHHLVLRGLASWDDVAGALVEHRTFLRRFVAEERVQTNEVQRSWLLVPCVLWVAERAGVEAVDLVELGPSAGFNLIWDRYRCIYAAGAWGPPDATLELSGEERRPVPPDLLARRLHVGSRIGVDRDPVDVEDEEQLLLLRSFIWPDQAWRFELFDRAVAEVRRDPPELVRGDAVEELPRLLARRRDAALMVVFTTAVLGYVPKEGRERVRETLHEAGRDGPLAFVGTGRPREEGADHWSLVARVWPGGERQVLAYADYHGTWLEWVA